MTENNQYLLNLHQRRAPTLENFVPGRNGEVVKVFRELRRGVGPQFVYIFGPVGVGVTHLLTSLDAYQDGRRVPEFKSGETLYIVDDVDSLDPGWAQQLLILQNEVRRHPEARLVCGGKEPIAQLDLPEGVKSRLGWGLSYAIEPLDEEERFAELERQARDRGIDISPEMQAWMASHLPRDMSTLLSVLDEADRLALARHRRLTLPLLREAVDIIEAALGGSAR